MDLFKKHTKRQHVLLTGGCGYIGSRLIPSLLKRGHQVSVLDIMMMRWEPPYSHPKLRVVRGDIRDVDLIARLIKGVNTVIHLAFISNDPDSELPYDIGQEINVQACAPLLEISEQQGVERFIFASSCSIYGSRSNDEELVHEQSTANPLTAYAKAKWDCEQLIKPFVKSSLCPVIVRPATVYGPSFRQRFDLTFNRMPAQAFFNQEIVVPNPERIRPSLYIQDMVRLYTDLLEMPVEFLKGKIWNVAFENQTVWEAAKTIHKILGPDIDLQAKSNSDIRSYKVSSQKIMNELNFVPQGSIEKATLEFKDAFEKGLYPKPLQNPFFNNIQLQKKYFSLIPNHLTDLNPITPFEKDSEGKRICVLGSPGSGKSTFSRELSRAINLPVIHMDDLYWEIDWKRPDELTFFQRLQSSLNQKNWILDGSYHKSYLEQRIANSNKVILLDFPTITSFFGIIQRFIKRRLGIRTSLPKNVRDSNKKNNRWELSFRFLYLILTYRRKVKPIILNKVNTHSGLEFIRIRSRKEAKLFLENQKCLS